MNINDEKSKQIRSAIQHQLSIHLEPKEALWQATAIFNLVVAQMKADFAAATPPSPTPKTPRTGRGSGGDASPSSSSPARTSSPWQPDDIQHLSEVDVQEAKKAVMFIFSNELLPIFPVPGEQCLNNYARHALVSAVILIIVVTRSPCSSPLPRSVRLDLTSSRFVRTRPSPPFWIG
mgnify:CR=1 FL=1